MAGRFFAIYVNKFITYVPTLMGSCAGIVLCSLGILSLKNSVEWIQPFIKINNFSIDIGIQVDKTSLIFALVLFIVSFIVQLYSISFMKYEPKNYRFYALLNLFNFGMAGLLFSPNLFQMYVFWELIGIVSYLLIGFDYSNPIKSESSRRVFIINRIGDTALVAGIIISSYLMYNYSGNFSFATLSFEDMNSISVLILAYTSKPLYLMLSGLFITAAVVKSAQFPFHIWLQDAMEAKLPVSALLHSATMVAAGVYLVIRMLPLFTLNESLMKIICALGILTAIICSLYACCEKHPKKVLAYSTSANLGLMFFALGFYNVKIAVIIFMAHAFIKSMLFLLLPKEDKTISYASFIFFVIGGLSLSGIIFAGFTAKEILFSSLPYNSYWLYLFVAASFLTAFYLSRLCILLFKNNTLTTCVKYAEFMPAISLILFNIYLYIMFPAKLSVLILYEIGGVVLAIITYPITKRFCVYDLCNYVYNKILPLIYNKLSCIADYTDNKIFANYKPIAFLSSQMVKFANFIEINIMHKSVQVTADFMKAVSKYDMYIQDKNVQTYNAYALILVTIIVSLVIISYMFIIRQLS